MANLGVCQNCGEVKGIVFHHKDGNHLNDVKENRIEICYKCHTEEHIKMRSKAGLPLSGRPPAIRTFQPFPRLRQEEIKREYEAYFPRL